MYCETEDGKKWSGEIKLVCNDSILRGKAMDKVMRVGHAYNITSNLLSRLFVGHMAEASTPKQLLPYFDTLIFAEVSKVRC